MSSHKLRHRLLVLIRIMLARPVIVGSDRRWCIDAQIAQQLRCLLCVLDLKVEPRMIQRLAMRDQLTNSEWIADAKEQAV